MATDPRKPERAEPARRRAPPLAAAIAAAILGGAAAPSLAQPTPAPNPAAPADAAPSTAPRTPAGMTGPAGEGRSYVIQPGIAARYTWSDNIDLRPQGGERAGSIAELAPFIRGDFATPRGYGSVNYQLRGFKYFGSEFFDNDVRQDLRAVGDVDLAGDALRVSALAQYFDLNRTPFGVGSIDPGARTLDRTTYRRFDLSPYSLGRLTAGTDYELRYRYSFVDPGKQYNSNSTNMLTAQVGSTAGQGRFGWQARGNANWFAYDNGFDYDTSLVELLGTVAPIPQLRLAAGVNYASSNVLLDADGKNSGFGPSVAMQWTPLPESQLTARWASTYYSDIVSVQGSHRVGRTRFGAYFDHGIRDGNQSSLLYYDPSRLFASPLSQYGSSSNRPLGALPAVGAGAGVPLVGSGVQSPVVDIDALVATFEYFGLRNDLLLTAYSNGLKPALLVPGFPASQPIDQRGVYARNGYRVDPRNTVSLDVRYQTSTNPDLDARSTLTSLGLEWRTALSRQLTGAVAARANRQRGTTGLPEYDERNVGAGLEYRF